MNWKTLNENTLTWEDNYGDDPEQRDWAINFDFFKLGSKKCTLLALEIHVRYSVLWQYGRFDDDFDSNNWKKFYLYDLDHNWNTYLGSLKTI